MKIQAALKVLPRSEPAPGLGARIFGRVLWEKKLMLRQQMRWAVGGLIGSLGLLFYGVYTFGNALTQSDFWNLASLAFFDLASVSHFWQDFFLSLLETAPVVPLLSLCMPLFIFLWAFSLYVATRENERYHFA